MLPVELIGMLVSPRYELIKFFLQDFAPNPMSIEVHQSLPHTMNGAVNIMRVVS